VNGSRMSSNAHRTILTGSGERQWAHLFCKSYSIETVQGELGGGGSGGRG
jgi:hypothetical protein